MKRDDLKALELSDEQIEKIMGLHGQTVNDLNGQIQSLTTEKQSLTDQVSQSSKQLEELKSDAQDNQALHDKITQLQADNTQLKSDSEAKLQATQKGFALDNALREAGALDARAVKPFLDEEAIKLDGESLIGLEDQLKTIKEDKSFLFQQKETKPAINAFKQGDPQGNPSNTTSDFAKALGIKQ